MSPRAWRDTLGSRKRVEPERPEMLKAGVNCLFGIRVDGEKMFSGHLMIIQS